MNDDTNKRLSKKNVIMLAASLVLGGIGVYIAQNYINDKISFYRAQMNKKEVMVEVVVPKRNLLRGDLVTAQDLSLREFPKQYIDSNTVNGANYKIALGQRMNFDIDEGKPLLWAHLEGGLTPTFSGKIDSGLRAITIPVDTINALSGFLQPKDNVDLLLTYKGNKGEMTFPFIQNLHIMATGVKTVVDKTGRASTQQYNTITVQVTPEEAKKIVLAQDVGKITAALRHPDDEVPMSKKVTTVADLFNKPPPRKKKAYRPPKKKGIEFIIGGV